MKKWSSTIKIILVGLITGISNGLFGSGGGIIAVPAMNLLLGVEKHDAHATALAIIFPLTLISTFIYIRNGLFDFELTWKVALGSMIGGYIGARLLTKLPKIILRKAFAVFMIIAAIRMIF